MDGAASLKLRNWMLPVAASSSKETWTCCFCAMSAKSSGLAVDAGSRDRLIADV